MMIYSLFPLKKNIFKHSLWWNHKIGCALFTLLLFKSLDLAINEKLALNIKDLYLLLCFIFLIISGYLINDWTDYEQDIITEKENLFRNNNWSILLIILFISILIALIASYFLISPLIFSLFVIQTILVLLYSLPAIRLKEKPMLSLFISGLYERAFPYFIIYLYIFNINFEKVFFLVIYLMWSFIWELRNHLNGQISDFENDKKSKTKTLSTLIGKEKTLILKKNLLIIEILFLILWVVFIVIIDIRYVFFLYWISIIVFFHNFTHYKIHMLSNIYVFNDYIYVYALLAAFSINAVFSYNFNYLCAGLILLFFSSTYMKNSLVWIISKFKD